MNREPGNLGLVADIRLREATPDDAGTIEHLRISTWQAAYRGLVPDRYLDALRPDAERRRGVLCGPTVGNLLACDDADVLGWCAFGPCRDEDRAAAEQGEIYACYVGARHWRHGAGSALFAGAMARLSAQGRDDVSLWVLEGNERARLFYERCGFRADGGRQELDLGARVCEIRYSNQGGSHP
jgi:ribosomal protein S18 acetylase RimI-like enzyme